ncbi:Outer membrane protein assembly factor BamE, lipoprotein component of the BamABCDE complex [Polynucleobacter meluiroseus]|jgi:outer membrane protein assembly factor BamE (lipoprotein component of BamABCDE complex)|uniref:Outer membrane protein assembly factor BamE, lipoprotein component of the BamABCDE complex n=1 Tax=Polynucleobacter meluiroseus TaxID=1938814 RepID=A0A240E3Y8_9BURK|nr:outer membrane protein assembly factor BamE [Polynucleobacter meluiroseus]SNX29580.1 Outer membrane protein assembly factor BamE, lipoprotein component of the BamABCDE complex [Polynucleobacter meluiroseus]
MKKTTFALMLVPTILVALSGCYPTSLVDQQKDMNAAKGEGDNLSIGKVQKEIRVGMSSSDVVSVLGSPNMVTTDDKRRESWVYDKVSTEAMASTSRGSGFLWFPADRNAAVSRTQKTLTIVIKFDEKGMVRDFAYNTSKF